MFDLFYIFRKHNNTKHQENGLHYGIKVRFPHALIMTIIYNRDRPYVFHIFFSILVSYYCMKLCLFFMRVYCADTFSIRENLRFILQATFQHSKNLGLFVGIFKTLEILGRRVQVCISLHSYFGNTTYSYDSYVRPVDHSKPLG